MKPWSSALMGALAFSLPFVLTGCPPQGTPAPNPTEAPGGTTFQPRDYFYPPSSTANWLYDYEFRTQFPGDPSDMVATGTVRVNVLSFEATRSVVESRLEGTMITGTESGLSVEATSSVSTESVVVEANGAVRVGDRRMTSEIFTSTGAIVEPATAEDPAIRISMAGQESVTVPAGTFTAVKLVEQAATTSATPSFHWLAKNVGRVKVSSVATFSAQADGVATTSVDIRLRTFTP